MAVAEIPISREDSDTASAAAARWLPAVAAAIAYPYALRLFVDCIHAARAGSAFGRASCSLGALATLAVSCAPAALALRALLAIRLDTTAQAIAARRLLHLVFAVPPVFLLCIRVAGGMNSLVGNTASGLAAWWGLWIVLSAIAWNAGRTSAKATGSTVTGVSSASAPAPLLNAVVGRSRKIHRVAVIAVLASFLILHLANHLFALWSIPAQRSAMLALRAWYRAAWIEPLILGLFVIAAATGLLRFARLSRGQADGFRVLQTACGVYLAFFLASHIWATLGARFHGIDTDWAFASGGKAGMLATGIAAAVLFYYVFALLAVAAHAGLGLRVVLLSRRVHAVAANRAARIVIAFGSAVSALIVAALLGLRIGG